ncbi:hypothetical protein [Streptomyces lydicus]|uniref:hypothetical protein n=1 Tax=Streptomyces lydicus TaxID=47763 RepID=UPI00286FECC9|nr:hypothetical protein [Streptomyces lydicus]
MRQPIARLFEALLRRLFPASGRRRAGALATYPEAPSAVCRPMPRHPAVRGEDTVLVRPYLVAHERAHGLEAVA